MTSKTQVGIIGAGPAGLTLALMLHREGISCVVLESRTRAYIEARTRAGLLEQNTVDLFDELGVAGRIKREGLVHRGVYLSFDEQRIRVPFDELTGGRCITIYGQQEIVKDLISACLEKGIDVIFDAEATSVDNITSNSPSIVYQFNGSHRVLSCEFVVGCDGFHGVARKCLPNGCYHEFRKDYPFSWLGILAYAKPATDELIYAYHQRGFALHSLRSDKVSRLYLQVSNEDLVDSWSDYRIWNELSLRLHAKGFRLNEGPIFEKSITPMRSFMIDNLQCGRLYLAGDAAHIVPPTGGKGLNLAVSDVKWLSEALGKFYKDKSENLLTAYTTNALRRIWRAQDFSNFMTNLFHKQASQGSFEYHLQKSKFDYIRLSKAYATTLAENYVGLKEI